MLFKCLLETYLYIVHTVAFQVFISKVSMQISPNHASKYLATTVGGIFFFLYNEQAKCEEHLTGSCSY